MRKFENGNIDLYFNQSKVQYSETFGGLALKKIKK
jgi:hypothetical protein